MSKTWTFRLSRLEPRSRRLILEGFASPPYERPYYDELFFYMVAGPQHLSLELSRDFDGDRLLAFFSDRLGEPAEPPRIQVGGRQDEEEGALVLVEWRFPSEKRQEMLERLAGVLGHPLAAPAQPQPNPQEHK